jgi:hypothetical protein
MLNLMEALKIMKYQSRYANFDIPDGSEARTDAERSGSG